MHDYKPEIIYIIRKNLKNNPADILLFGSRADGKASNLSDFDIAIRSETEIYDSVMDAIREELENSNIPFKIDLVDYNKVSDKLRLSIDRSSIKW